MKKAIVSAAVDAFLPDVPPDVKAFMGGVTNRQSPSDFDAEAAERLDGRGEDFFKRLGSVANTKIMFNAAKEAGVRRTFPAASPILTSTRTCPTSEVRPS